LPCRASGYLGCCGTGPTQRWFRAICPDIFSASYFVPELLDETKGRPISLLEFFLPCLDSLVRPLDLLGDLFYRDVLGHGLNQ
jgi:hypothetical protein